MFFVAIDSAAVEAASAGTCAFGRFRRVSCGCRSCSITPERATAALITSAQAMMTTTSLVKPKNACFTLTTPPSTLARRAASATTS